MISIYDILKKTILSSQLNEKTKQTFMDQLIESVSKNDASGIRKIISNPVINGGIGILEYNPTAIMRDTYIPGISFKSQNTDTDNNNNKNNNGPKKPVTDKNIKNAVIITKEQETGIGKSGNQEIIKSSIQIVQMADKFNSTNSTNVPINQNQSYKYSDETPLNNEILVDNISKN
jgi:hypothetical protein